MSTAPRPAPRTFAELLATEGVNETVELRSPFGFMAFHGGLEAGTETVAAQAAAAAGASLYLVVQPPDLRWHIPSQRVAPADSPALARFLNHITISVALHGYGRVDRPNQLLLGGNNRRLASHLARHLRSSMEDFQVVEDLDMIPPEMRGLHPDNPVNRPADGGVQLELPPMARGSSGRRLPGGPPCTPVAGLVSGLADAALTWAPWPPQRVGRPRRPI